MIPEIIESKEKEPVIKTNGSRNTKPHVAHLVLTNLQDVTEMWWSEIKEMLISKSVLDRRFAITEINKIQVKSMPTNITADEGVNIQVNVVQYGNKTNSNPVQLLPATIPGAVVEGDGQRDSKSS